MKKYVLFFGLALFSITLSHADDTSDTKTQCLNFLSYVKNNKLDTRSYQISSSPDQQRFDPTLVFVCESGVEKICIFKDYLDGSAINFVFMNRNHQTTGRTYYDYNFYRLINGQSEDGNIVQYDPSRSSITINYYEKSSGGSMQPMRVKKSSITLNSSRLSYTNKVGAAGWITNTWEINDSFNGTCSH